MGSGGRTKNALIFWDITYKPSKLNTFWKCFVCLTASLALVALCRATSANLKDFYEHVDFQLFTSKGLCVEKAQALERLECMKIFVFRDAHLLISSC